MFSWASRTWASYTKSVTIRNPGMVMWRGLIKFKFVIKNIKLVKHIIFQNSPTLWIKIPILTIFRKHIRILGHKVICPEVYHFYNYWKLSSGFLIDSGHFEILSFNVKTCMKIQSPISSYKQTKIENKSTNIQNPVQRES